MSYRSPTAAAGAPPALRGSLTPAQVLDLILVAELMIFLPGLLQVDLPWLRIPLGLFCALFAPGYALTAALFPTRADLDRVARAALSLGLSVALIPLLALLLDRLPWGLRPVPIAVGLCLLTVLFCLVAARRRYLGSGPYALLTASPGPRALPRLGPGHYAAAGACVLVAAWGVAVYAAVLTTPTRLTEFYALGAGGLAEDYPRAAVAGEPLALTLGISNQEGATRRYMVVVEAAGQGLAEAGPIELADGASWSEPVSFSLPAAGPDQAVDILLYSAGEPEPYRRLRLWIDVGDRR